jgi:allantoicase
MCVYRSTPVRCRCMLCRAESRKLTPVRNAADGGVKRVRLYGRRASQFPSYSALAPLPSPKPTSLLGSIASAVSPSKLVNGTNPAAESSSSGVPKVLAVPLTPDAFSAYGSVIQSYPDQRSARKDVVIKPVNFGTAFKFNHLAPVTFVPPASRPDLANRGQVNFCVFRCDAQDGVKGSASGQAQWPVKVLERHEFSSQAFVPMGNGGSRYLVIVCLPGAGECGPMDRHERPRERNATC